MSNDYIFFGAALCDRFLAFARARGLAAEGRRDELDCYVVALPDTLDDELDAAIEAEYENLMIEQRDLVEADDDSHTLMGVTVELPDGDIRQVRVPRDHGRRLMEHFTLDEIRELVTAIAREVVAPREGPLCRR